MAIPDVDTLTLPVLQRLSKRISTTTELVEAMAKQFNLTEQERQEKTPKKERPTKFENLVHFALNRLTSSKLITHLSPGSVGGPYDISERGREVISNPPELITYEYLKGKFPDFNARRADANEYNTDVATELGSVKAPTEAYELAALPIEERPTGPAMSKSTNMILYGPPGYRKNLLYSGRSSKAVR